MDTTVIASIVTGIFALLAGIIAAAITSERILFSSFFRKQKLPHGFVFLINGSSGVGKTTLAWAIARKYNIVTVLGTDFIRESYRYLIDTNKISDAKLLLTSSFLAHVEIDPTEFQNNESKVILGFKKQSEFLVGPLSRIINRIRTKRYAAIIEGVNMISTQMFEKLPIDPHNKILFINLYIDDTKTQLERIRKRGEKTSELPQQTDKYVTNLDSIREIDKYLKECADETHKKCNNILSIENSSTVSVAIKKIDNYINELKKKHKSIYKP